jgi:HEAT repeat protein
MKRRLALSTGALLCVGVAAIFCFPASRSGVLGLVRGERFEGLRPASSWAQALKDDDEKVRQEAVKTLARIAATSAGAEEFIPELSEALKDTDKEVRVNASFALMNMARRVKLPINVLCAALKDELPHVRLNSAMALRLNLEHIYGEQGAGDAKEAVPALIAAIDDKANIRPPGGFYVSVRHEAARSLGLIGAGARDAIPALSAAAKVKEDGLLAEQAGKALKLIDPKAATEEGVK